MVNMPPTTGAPTTAHEQGPKQPRLSPAAGRVVRGKSAHTMWPPPSYGGGARRVEGDRISRGDCNIRTSRYIGCFGISCRAKIEVVERPPPVPPPPPPARPPPPPPTRAPGGGGGGILW